MPYVITTSSASGSLDGYRKVNEHLGDEPIPGLIAHYAGVDASGHLAVTSVWASKADSDRFTAERLLPAFRAVSGEVGDPPTIVDFEVVNVRVGAVG